MTIAEKFGGTLENFLVLSLAVLFAIAVRIVGSAAARVGPLAGPTPALQITGAEDATFGQYWARSARAAPRRA